MNETEEIFPVEDVEASLQDTSLQAANSFSELESELRRDLEAARTRAVEAGASQATRWIYFSSPDWTWQRLCGREGWLLYDPETKTQLDFVMTVMN